MSTVTVDIKPKDGRSGLLTTLHLAFIRDKVVVREGTCVLLLGSEALEYIARNKTT